jgi:glycosyltransferase involved in cell wall biosynthesis
MRILVDARPIVDADSRGVAAVVFDVLQRMIKDPDADFVFVTTGWKILTLPEPFKTHPRVTHVHIRIPNKLWTALSMLNLVSLDKAAMKKSGLTFDQAFIGNLGFTGSLTTPYTLLLHDLSFLIEPRWFSLKSRLWHRAVHCKRLIRRADKILCVSETTRRDVERISGEWGGKSEEEKQIIEVFTPHIRPIQFNPESNDSPLPTPPSPLFVLAMGGGNPRKNIPTIIAAVERLRMEPEFAELKLVIIGAPKRECGKRSEERGARSEFVIDARDFMNSLLAPRSSLLSDLDLDRLYATASCFLYPSWYEGYGLPLHEAARFNCPCIASSTGALPETAPPGTIFVPPSKPHLWVGAIRDILKR